MEDIIMAFNGFVLQPGEKVYETNLKMLMGIPPSAKKNARRIGTSWECRAMNSLAGNNTMEKEKEITYENMQRIYKNFMRLPHLYERLLIPLGRDLTILSADLIGFENPPRKIS
ncbi:hypothetical protein PUN28_018549 [Cardiocondyla obscurior]|uniref:Uncharacterized protein n=1 Tax=Cardiocondyla obscurior TaxID=286306 RepID=A0AAW2EED3_9HYME